ncbi:MAG: carboxypeptidase regulatory-like domain-containing protein [Candidatus Eisenbacteria bacterium]|nr:carboxypeptidase regulatory-like domain-containing protein [Candidatus Eisenbacteria bacterium]
MNPRMRPATRNLAIATLLCAFSLLHCDRAPNRSLLTPTGGGGGPTCKSKFTKIQVAGDFNGWSLTAAPSMTAVGCVWTATVLNVTAGEHKFKFVTNGAFDNPLDYGSDEVCRPALNGTISAVSGSGTAICVTFAKAANYRFTLDEEALTFRIEEVVVQQPATLRGSVAFGGSPPAGLKAAVTALLAGTQTVAASDTTAQSFVFEGLEAGRYDVRFAAPGYLDTVRAGVLAAAGQTVDLGPTVLRTGCASQFHTIQLAGNFNPDLYGNFDLARSPQMTKIAGCVWQGTVNSVTAGQHYFKMVTDGAFDNPKDYGGDEGRCLTVTHDTLLTPVRQVSGTGTALCVTFPDAGNYRFTLDESAGTVLVERLVVANPGSVTGHVLFPGTPAAGARASVRVFAAGTANQLGADSTAAGAASQAFAVPGIPPGSVDVRVAAVGYRDTSRTGVTVTAGQAADIGTLALTAVVGCVSRAHTSMILTGNFAQFPSFDLSRSPHMTRLGTCRWQVTVDSVKAGEKFLKFVVDSSATRDGYGGDENNCLALSPAGGLTSGVTHTPGVGGNLCVTFTPGRYRFTLDEQSLTFTIERLAPGAPRRTAWRAPR